MIEKTRDRTTSIWKALFQSECKDSDIIYK